MAKIVERHEDERVTSLNMFYHVPSLESNSFVSWLFRLNRFPEVLSTGKGRGNFPFSARHGHFPPCTCTSSRWWPEFGNKLAMTHKSQVRLCVFVQFSSNGLIQLVNRDWAFRVESWEILFQECSRNRKEGKHLCKSFRRQCLASGPG